MMRILTDTGKETKKDEVETTRLKGREDVVDATCHMRDKEDALEFAETGTGNYLTSRAGSDDEIFEYRGDF